MNTSTHKSKSFYRGFSVRLVVMVTLVSLSLNFLYYLYLADSAKESFRLKIVDYSSHLRDSLEWPLWNIDDELIKRIGDTFAANQEVIFLGIHDENDRLVYHYQKHPEAKSAIRTVIKHDGQDIGSIKLGLSREVFEQQVSELQLVSLFNTATLALVLILMSRWVWLPMLKKPISDMVRVTEDIDAGNYKKIRLPETHLEFIPVISALKQLSEAVETRETSLKNLNGELLSEINERKSAEQKLAEYRDQLELTVAKRTEELRNQKLFSDTVLENIEDGIVACDEHGSLNLFNRATRNLHGIDREDLPPGQWAKHYKLFHNDGKTIMSTEEIPLVRAFQGEKLHNEYLVIEHANGKKRTVICSGQPMYNKNKDKVGAVVSMHDMTEQIKAEKELREARDIAETSNKAKSQFLANMSHELRTPMHSILSFTNLALKKEENDKIKHFLKNIHTSSVRLTHLLNDLLDLSKLEAGKMQVDFSKQDLTSLICSTVDEIDSLLMEKSITVEINKEQIFESMIDQKLLTQVFVNIFSNAIKFSPENSVINIELQKTKSESNGLKEDQIKISIKDQGVGIPEDQLDLIFNQFAQSSMTKNKSEGTGLGLPISKRIIELHNGRIWAESPPKDSSIGSVIYVQIPVNQTLAEEA